MVEREVMTMTTSYAPNKCVECSTGLSVEAVEAGDVDTYKMTVRGHVLEIPGMFTCVPCAGAIMIGDKASTVTFRGAADYMAVMVEKCHDAIEHIEDDALRGLVALTEVENFMEVQFVMEALDMLKDEPEGLDFIPECDGHCGDHGDIHSPHPAEVAHLN